MHKKPPHEVALLNELFEQVSHWTHEWSAACNENDRQRGVLVICEKAMVKACNALYLLAAVDKVSLDSKNEAIKALHLAISEIEETK